MTHSIVSSFSKEQTNTLAPPDGEIIPYVTLNTIRPLSIHIVDKSIEQARDILINTRVAFVSSIIGFTIRIRTIRVPSITCKILVCCIDSRGP